MGAPLSLDMHANFCTIVIEFADEFPFGSGHDALFGSGSTCTFGSPVIAPVSFHHHPLNGSLFLFIASPPLRPAIRASSFVNWCAVPTACAARPPRLETRFFSSGERSSNPRFLRGGRSRGLDAGGGGTEGMEGGAGGTVEIRDCDSALGMTIFPSW